MTRTRTNNSIGFTPRPDFTPQAEPLPPSDLSGLIPCQLSEPGTARSTVLHVRPANVRTRIDEYALLGQVLIPPKWFAVPPAPEQPAPASAPETEPDPVRTWQSKRGGKPVIDLSTGQYYNDSVAASAATGISPAMIRNVTRGRFIQAKGRRFRLASPEEKAEASVDVNWKLKG